MKANVCIGALVLVVVLIAAVIMGSLGGRAGFLTNLDGALRLGLQMTLENLANRALEVSPESREALAYLDQTERKEKKEFRNQCRIYKLGYIKLQGNSESGSESNSRSNSESISLTANL